MHKKRTNALIFSDMDATTKGSKKQANKMTFSTFRQKNDVATEPEKCAKTTKSYCGLVKREQANRLKHQALSPGSSTKRYL